MSKPTDGEFSSIRVRPAVHRRVKILAAMAGKPLADFAGELLEPALDKVEKELTRLRGSERPSRSAD